MLFTEYSCKQDDDESSCDEKWKRLCILVYLDMVQGT